MPAFLHPGVKIVTDFKYCVTKLGVQFKKLYLEHTKREKLNPHVYTTFNF